jgi:alpha-D-ribose 1-methylphosphonate 5-triphosphate synthase subunit PhnG
MVQGKNSQRAPQFAVFDALVQDESQHQAREELEADPCDHDDQRVSDHLVFRIT